MNSGEIYPKECTEKSCLTCGRPFRGRSDKKFCKEYCRNSYNNHRKEKSSPRAKQINKILHRNSVILRSSCDPTKSITLLSKMDLLRQGFDFRYYTHVLTSDKGQQYNFCYEYGYADFGKDGIAVVGDPFTCH